MAGELRSAIAAESTVVYGLSLSGLIQATTTTDTTIKAVAAQLVNC